MWCKKLNISSCIQCNKNDFKHKGFGLCIKCHRKERYLNRDTEVVKAQKRISYSKKRILNNKNYTRQENWNTKHLLYGEVWLIKRLYEGNISAYKIARMFKVSKTAILAHLHKAKTISPLTKEQKLEIYRASVRTFEDNELINAVRKNGLSFSDCAKLFETGYGNIVSRARRLGLKTDNKSQFVFASYLEKYNLFTKTTSIRALEINRYICKECNGELDPTIKEGPYKVQYHHVVPVSVGGKSVLDNCQPIHQCCHYSNGQFKKLHKLIYEKNKMALSGSGMKGDIESQIAGLVSGTDFGQGNADACVLAIAQACCDHVSGSGLCNLTIPSNGACSNTLLAPGAYTGTGNLSSGGSIYGLSAGTLKGMIEGNISGGDFSQGNSDAVIGAVADAVVTHVQSSGKVTVTTTDTGVAPAHGGSVIAGTGVGVGQVDSLVASTLHGLLKSKISGAVAGCDFGQGNSDNCLLGLATGIVNHIMANAQVTVNATLSVTCPPAGGSGSGNGIDGAATIA